MDLFRPEPVGPHGAYDTYALRAPRQTHWRLGTCEEFGQCSYFQAGFKVLVDPADPIGQRRLAVLRAADNPAKRRPKPVETRRQDGLIECIYPAGTPCFGDHWVPLEREPVCLVRRGDWRTPAALRRSTVRPMAGRDWLDRFGTNQVNVADAQDARKGG